MTIVGGDANPAPPFVIVKPVIPPAFILTVIFINPQPLNDIIGAAVYPVPLLVIVTPVIAPAATAAVAVARVPNPFIKTVGAEVQPVPPVFTAIELTVEVTAANVLVIPPVLIFEAFET